MTKYMQEVLDWMFGKKSKRCYEDIFSDEAKEFHNMKKKVYARCVKYITDEDIKEAYRYVTENYGYCGPRYAIYYFKLYEVLPARDRIKNQKKGIKI